MNYWDAPLNGFSVRSVHLLMMHPALLDLHQFGGNVLERFVRDIIKRLATGTEGGVSLYWRREEMTTNTVNAHSERESETAITNTRYSIPKQIDWTDRFCVKFYIKFLSI